MPVRMLDNLGEGVDTRHVPAIGGPTSIREGNRCQRGHWVPKGVDCEIHWRGEQNIVYKSENISLADTL